jgi:hypothetical protein
MTIKRLEFKTSVKLEILKRSGFPENPICEGCGRSLRGEKIEIDHVIEEWERGGAHDGRRELTASDGQALGAKCCHRDKSARKRGEKAHGDRIIKKAAGIERKTRPMPGSKASGFRKRMDGTVERRT